MGFGGNKYWDEDQYEKFTNYQLQINDIVIAVTVSKVKNKSNSKLELKDSN
jgi:hypothetical protein